MLDSHPDAKLRSPWRTYRLCLERLDVQEGLILQDDAVVCEGFLDAAAAAVAARPGRLIAFFHGGTPAMRQSFAGAHARGDPFVEIVGNSWVPTVALYWPAGAARALLDWLDSRQRGSRRGIAPERRADDAIVGEWARKTRRGALVTVPCLVEHPDEEPSLIGARARAGRDRARVAVEYVGAGAETWARALAIRP